MNQPIVKIENGKPMTTSVAVAEYFSKNHWDVMRAIKDVLTHCSEPFSLRNFAESTYRNPRGQNYPCVFMTKSGFAMTALGFTGQKAIEFREAYITRFDEMEAKLADKKIQKLEESYVRQLILPGDEPLLRDSIPCGEAVKHLHILRLYPTLTAGQLKGKVKRGELEGHQDERGHWRIYVDQVTKLATGH